MLRQFLFLSIVEGLYRLGQVLITAVVARTLGPAGYGLIASAQAFSNYASIIADSGTGLYGMHKVAAEKKSGGISRSAVSQVLTTRIFLAVAVYLALVCCVLMLTDGRLTIVATLSGLVVLATALRMDWLAKGNTSSQMLVFPNLIALGSTLLFLLLFVRDESDLYQAALIPVISVAISASALFFMMRHKMPGVIGLDINLSHTANVIRKSFPAAVGALTQGGSHLVPLIFLGWLGLTELGFFNAAYNLVFPVAALAIYFMNSAIPHVQTGGTELQKIRQAITRAAGFGIGTGCTAAIIAPWAVVTLYGQAYTPAGSVAQLLSVALAIQFVRHMLRGMGMVIGANVRHEFLSGLAATSVSLLTCVVLVEKHGAMGAAAAVCLGELTGTLLAWAFLRKGIER